MRFSAARCRRSPNRALPSRAPPSAWSAPSRPDFSVGQLLLVNHRAPTVRAGKSSDQQRQTRQTHLQRSLETSGWHPFTKCAKRSLGTASRQWRRMTSVELSPTECQRLPPADASFCSASGKVSVERRLQTLLAARLVLAWRALSPWHLPLQNQCRGPSRADVSIARLASVVARAQRPSWCQAPPRSTAHSSSITSRRGMVWRRRSVLEAALAITINPHALGGQPQVAALAAPTTTGPKC